MRCHGCADKASSSTIDGLRHDAFGAVACIYVSGGRGSVDSGRAERRRHNVGGPVCDLLDSGHIAC